MKGDFRIADWDVQPQLNCIRRGDHSSHLEPKVMQVLVQLATHSDEVLSKERLIQAVWADTFVGDDVLTRSIREIRRAFEDDARAPRIVQTIPKVGYRLIAPVEFSTAADAQRHSVVLTEVAAGGTAVSTVVGKDVAESDAAAPKLSVVGRPPLSEPPVADHVSRNRFGKLWWLFIPALVIFGLALGWWMRPMKKPAPPRAALRTVPFTSYPGAQTQPAFSPDGNQLAFSWNGASRDNFDIYVKVVGTETPLRLTDGPGRDFSPAWSPDGRSIAFLRTSEGDRGIYLVPALGGVARKIYSPVGKIEWERASLSWSPNGKELIFPDGKTGHSPSQIFALDAETLRVRPLSMPPDRWDGDISPVYSPEGSYIAFIRATEGYVRDIYVMNADGTNVRRVTRDNRTVSSLAWTNDGQSLIFSSDRGGKPSLWKIPFTGGTPERLEVGGDDANSPAIARHGRRLAYVQSNTNWSIIHIDLRAGSSRAQTPLFSSTLQDSSPQFSPDGKRVAFQSWRSGPQEVWICNSDGSSPVKLTSFEGPVTGSPHWSPDGKQIVFDSRPSGRSHVFTMRVDGGVPQPLTGGDGNDIVPSWSHDGSYIYFGSNRTGAWEIWKVASHGGAPVQVTTKGGFIATEAPDGQWLYYTKADAPGLFRIRTTGGEEEKILDEPRLAYWGYWSVTKDGIYYLKNNSIVFKNLADGSVKEIAKLLHTPPPYAGLTVAPSGSELLYSDQTEGGSNITLVENFE